jgi:LmbE family N-acetylglucosaminyl deacetylase
MNDLKLKPLEPLSPTLIISAHPDDVDFGCAGSVALWRRQGVEVVYCIITDGDAGGFDRSIPRSQIPGIRRREQLDAAKAVGVEAVEFLGYRDGSLTVTMELRRDLAAVIRRYRPQRVICQSPVRNFERIGASHPDHLAAGEASLQAVYPDSRNPFAHPELLERGLEPHVVIETVLTAHPQPTHYVDITDTVDEKLAAISAHVSQLPEPDALEGNVKQWLSRAAEAANLGEGRFAELFFPFKTA